MVGTRFRNPEVNTLNFIVFSNMQLAESPFLLYFFLQKENMVALVRPLGIVWPMLNARQKYRGTFANAYRMTKLSKKMDTAVSDWPTFMPIDLR